MDPKTKALLHTSAAVVAAQSPHLDMTTITVYPPEASMAISNEMILSAKDEKMLIAHVAKHLGKNVAKAVEEQILKAYEMDAKEAFALVWEAKKDFLASKDYTLFWDAGPFDAKQDTVWALPELKTAPAPTVTAQSVKEAFKAIQDAQFTKTLGGIIPEVWATEVAKQLGGYVSPVWWIDDVDGTPIAVTSDEATETSITKVFHEMIPGFAKMRQDCPRTTCYRHGNPDLFLQDTIIHLNDRHKWTREAIADWLETLDHDLTFKTPEEVKNGNSN